MVAGLIDRLFSEVDPQNISVKPFDGYIFLCGGALESDSGSIESARHYALTRMDSEGRIAGRRVMIAEKLTSLLHGDDFRDLLEFEEHIAVLSACVLIFVESPGSIAELGSFSVMPHLASKLLVVCEQRMGSALTPGFIFLGPVASLKRARANSVQIFPMFKDESSQADVEKLSECWQFIEESVLESVKRPIAESPLDPAELSHGMVAVAAMIDIFVALKLGELQEAVSRLGIEISTKHLRRMTRTLEQFALIKRVPYGNEDFYFSTSDSSLLTFRPKDRREAKIFDQIRFKADTIEYYAGNDSRRYKAIISFQKARML